jgi:hypothetical protein
MQKKSETYSAKGGSAGLSSNPSFYVSRVGNQLLSPVRLKDGKNLSSDAIRELLLSLGPEDWPEGCRVSVVEPGVRSGSDNDLIERNLKVLRGVLDGLGITVGEKTSA